MSAELILPCDFISIKSEKNIFLTFFNSIRDNPKYTNDTDTLKNYILNYQLYIFYKTLVDRIEFRTHCNPNDLRKSLLQSNLIKRLNLCMNFFYNRMIMCTIN